MSFSGVIEEDHQRGSPATADQIRAELIQYAKDFKTIWVDLGRALYPVWKDKLFYGWGYDKFEYYLQRELGIKRQTAMKLLKTYYFLEQEEPAYLKKEYAESKMPVHVPDCDTVNVLRLARTKKEVNRDDYSSLREAVFLKGKDATVVRKDLTAIMKQRKEVDPEEERQKRSDISVRKLITAMNSFKKDMETLQLLPHDLIEEAQDFIKKLEEQIEEASYKDR